MSYERPGFIRSALEWIAVFAIALGVVLLVRTFVIEPYVVPTGSMESTIQVGDQLLAQKVTTLLGIDPSVGDIVVFENPEAGSEHDVLIKRVVATAGQTVDFSDGNLLVDGEPFTEPYAEGLTQALPVQADGVSIAYPYTVPEGCVWVMGDNRENSADSRYFGPVSCDSVIGVAVVRYWPLTRMGGL